MNRAPKTQPVFVIALIGALIPSLVSCTPVGENLGAYSGTLILQGKHTYQDGKTLPGVLILIDGEAVLEPGAQVDGAVYVLGGALNLNSEVGGDVSVIGGQVVIGPQTRLHGDLRVGSGEYQLSPGASIDGQVLIGAASGLEVNDLLPQRSLQNQLVWLVPEALILAGMAYLLTRYLPSPLDNVRQAAVKHPLISAAMGLLAGIVLPALLVVMAYTLILIPVTLLGLVIGFLVIGYGYIALGVEAGQRLARWRQIKLSPSVIAFLGTGMFYLSINLLGIIPLVGPLLNLMVAVLVVGAVLLTRFGYHAYSPPYEVDREFSDHDR